MAYLFEPLNITNLFLKVFDLYSRPELGTSAVFRVIEQCRFNSVPDPFNGQTFNFILKPPKVIESRIYVKKSIWSAIEITLFHYTRDQLLKTKWNRNFQHYANFQLILGHLKKLRFQSCVCDWLNEQRKVRISVASAFWQTGNQKYVYAQRRSSQLQISRWEKLPAKKKHQ